MRRDAPGRSRSRSRSRGRDWGAGAGGSSPPSARYRAEPASYRADSRADRRPTYDEYSSRGGGDLRGDSGADYPPRSRVPAPAAYRGEGGYERGSAGYESRGGAYDRR